MTARSCLHDRSVISCQRVAPAPRNRLSSAAMKPRARRSPPAKPVTPAGAAHAPSADRRRRRRRRARRPRRPQRQRRRRRGRASPKAPSTCTSPTATRSSTPCTCSSTRESATAVIARRRAPRPRHAPARQRHRRLSRRLPRRSRHQGAAPRDQLRRKSHDDDRRARAAVRAARRTELQSDGLARPRSPGPPLRAMTSEAALMELEAGKRLPAVRRTLERLIESAAKQR